MTDKVEAESNYLMNDRTPNSKPFSYDLASMKGKTTHEMYMEDYNFKATHDLHK